MVKRGRGKGKKSRYQKDSNLKGLLTVVATVALVGAATIPMVQVASQPQVDTETSCLEGKTDRLTVFMIDQTNKIAHSYQVQHIKKTILKEIDGMTGGIGEQVAFYFLHQERGKSLDYLFRRCVPMRGSEASLINSNADMVNADYQRLFHQPVQEILEQINTFNLSNQSAILSELKNIVVRAKSDGIKELRLVVFSDFLNNSKAFSHYAKNVKQSVNQERFLVSQEAEALRTDMKGVNIDMHYLYQKKVFGRNRQTKAHENFWTEWFDLNGATSFITKI